MTQHIDDSHVKREMYYIRAPRNKYQSHDLSLDEQCEQIRETARSFGISHETPLTTLPIIDVDDYKI
ncbi:MAG: hypothetical protein J6Q89_08740 [Clostridia bacterium]|nr:hypothetical protein [Clostridia bacterium]